MDRVVDRANLNIIASITVALQTSISASIISSHPTITPNHAYPRLQVFVCPIPTLLASHDLNMCFGHDQPSSIEILESVSIRDALAMSS